MENLIEGLPARQWQLTQAQYYDSIGSQLSPKRWIAAILRLLNNTAWDQWEYRNHVLHKTEQPREKYARRLLDEEITKEVSLGPSTLRPGDRHHFSIPLLDLLRKPLPYKKAWLVSVHAARQISALHVQLRTQFFQPRRQIQPPDPPNPPQPQQVQPQPRRQRPQRRQRQGRRTLRNPLSPNTSRTQRDNIFEWMRTGRIR